MNKKCLTDLFAISRFECNFFFFVITEHLEVYPTTETIIYDENGIPIRSGSPDEVELSKSIKEEGPFNPKTGFTPG